MRIVIGSDHAGRAYKDRIVEHLTGAGHEVTDLGIHSDERCDYPRCVRPVAEAVAAGGFDRGIVLGGSGNGEAMVANRLSGIRCALCWDLRSARLSREHNDANVLALGQRMISIEAALEIVDHWLAAEFAGGRHARRVRMIDGADAPETPRGGP